MKILRENDIHAIDSAVSVLKAGKVISFNCETVYGLAVDASNKKAVDALYHIKKRSKKKPLVIFLPHLNAAKKIFRFDNFSLRIAKKFLPGNLTLVLETKKNASDFLAENLNEKAPDKTLGFRIVDRQFIKKLLKKFDGIIAVTSANPSNHAAAISSAEVQNYFTKDEVTLLIDGGTSCKKTASTVASIRDKKIEILRQGAIPNAMLEL